MGSPTSFPVLCVVNLALTRLALEARLGKVIPLHDLDVLINGDDIGFVTDKYGYALWQHITSLGGLAPSMGKNFTSTKFIILNSAMFVASTDGTSRRFDYTPHINYGILKGPGEGYVSESSLLPSDDPRTPSVDTMARDLIKGHPLALQVNLLKRFISSWKPCLDKFLPRGMSYWLPRHLGGLGLPCIGEYTNSRSSSEKTRFSRSQLVMASYLNASPERQQRLKSPPLGQSDSFSLWKLAAPAFKLLMRGVCVKYKKKKELVEEDVASINLMSSVTTNVLAKTFMDLKKDDFESKIDPSEPLCDWQQSYQKLFKHCESCGFPPISDEDLSQSTPFVEYYPYLQGVCDQSSRVDLRL